MPVKVRILMALVLMLPAIAQGQERREVILKAEQLVAKDRQVRAYKQPYIVASSASLVYSQCGEKLAITPAQQAFFKQRYEALSRAFLGSFEEAFVNEWNVPSNTALTQDYIRYLVDIRTPAVTQIGKTIASKGCADKSVKSLLSYFLKIQQSEEGGVKVPLAPTINKR